MLSLRPTAMFVGGNVTLGLPMNRWSYSTATDQFGAKPTSIPVPTAPPQRVSLAKLNGTPAAAKTLLTGKKLLYLLSVTAAPPFAYRRTLCQIVADLTGEEADGVDLGPVGVGN